MFREIFFFFRSGPYGSGRNSRSQIFITKLDFYAGRQIRENNIFDTENIIFGTENILFGTENITIIFGTENTVFGNENITFGIEHTILLF